MLKYFLTLIIIAYWNNPLYSQDCKGIDQVNWKTVEVKEMTNTNPPEGYEVAGEWFIKNKKGFSDLSKISKSDLKKIKKRVAKYGCCLVYIDIKNKTNYPKGILYYWVKSVK